MTTDATTGPPGRRPKRGPRVRAAHPAAAPFITRAIPPYEMLSDELLATIEAHADQLLEEIGLEIRGDADAIRLWRDAGADIVDDCRVRVPRGLARAIVRRSAPATFTQHARNPARSVTIGGRCTVLAPAYGSPFVSDADGGRRYGTLADFRNFVKLAYLSPWLHHSGGTVCEPTDLPVNKRHLDMLYAHMALSDKPFMGSVTSAARAADSIEMCRILFGRDFVDRHCVILGNVNVNSPLVLDGEASRVIRTYAAANQAPVCVPFILGGAMGPVTTAGGLAQCFAEALFCVALGQLERAGPPAILGNFLSSMSLRSGAPTFGTPEPALAYFAIGQLARRLGVPLRCGGNLCGSKLPTPRPPPRAPIRCGRRSSPARTSCCTPRAGSRRGLAMSYEKFVMDLDQCGVLHVVGAGLGLDENGFALDAFREVGPGKHFLGSAHTLRNYETAFFDAELADNNSFEQWVQEGSRDVVWPGAPPLAGLLAAYEPPPLDAAADEALHEFIARRKASMPDMAY